MAPGTRESGHYPARRRPGTVGTRGAAAGPPGPAGQDRRDSDADSGSVRARQRPGGHGVIGERVKASGSLRRYMISYLISEDNHIDYDIIEFEMSMISYYYIIIDI